MDIYEIDSGIFPPSINALEDVIENDHCNRTFRRTSDTRALEEHVSSSDIYIVNKWDQIGLQKRVAGQPMKKYYAQFELLKPFLRYTFAM